VECRVCLGSARKYAVICDKCSLIAHSQCAREAPPTCDLRSQLLQYAQLAQMSNSHSTPSNPVHASSGPATTAIANVGVCSPCPRRSAELIHTACPTSPTKGTSGLKFIGGFGRSRSSLSVACSVAPPSADPPSHSHAEKIPRRISSKLARNVSPNERPQSVSSDGTAPKSLMITDSHSTSRQEPSRKSQFPAVEPNYPSQANGMISGYKNLNSDTVSQMQGLHVTSLVPSLRNSHPKRNEAIRPLIASFNNYPRTLFLSLLAFD